MQDSGETRGPGGTAGPPVRSRSLFTGPFVKGIKRLPEKDPVPYNIPKKMERLSL
jgi:hypothetical protein